MNQNGVFTHEEVAKLNLTTTSEVGEMCRINDRLLKTFKAGATFEVSTKTCKVFKKKTANSQARFLSSIEEATKFDAKELARLNLYEIEVEGTIVTQALFVQSWKAGKTSGKIEVFEDANGYLKARCIG